MRSLLAQQLWARILLGMGLGTITGLALSPGGFALLENETALTAAEWIALPGTVFLEILKMVVIPLIICSIVLGILSSGSPRQLKKMGAFIVPYFIATSFVAVTIGLSLSLFIQPGHMMSAGAHAMVTDAISTASAPILDELTVPQRITRLIPSNFVEAALHVDMLKIVIIAIFFGVAALTMPREIVKPFEALCLFGQGAAMQIIDWAMALAPYAVFGLMTDAMIHLGFDALSAIGWYMTSVLSGLAIILSLYLFGATVFGGHSPTTFLRAIREVQLLAFSTSSSAAVMPVSIRTAENNLGVSEDISRFVIPIGATINMDGTGLYQAVAAIFLCQIFGVDLSFTEMALLMCVIVGASIGTPATPGVGIVVLATILSGIGVPPAGIGIIFGVDRILDMCRTTINVTGDLTAVVIMERWMKSRSA
ncbi:dicarboxylate/amino acid:cation symporter [Nitrosomonas eutropha]|uniref:dicarboxylate/amino acid:cation symporter n=1 Tax=Nitrosomonas eutropha TaxID=916 RepID=UPI00210D78B8|nr:dicarboxylate/amino acid:cation symporter [Nitrosomonas eutropha]